MTFDRNWGEMTANCPHSMADNPFAWVKWMRDEGCRRRLDFEIMACRIVGILATHE